jgi:flagellar biosynthetic protein FlhF
MSVRIRKVYGKTPKEARQNAQKEFGDNISIIRMRPVSPNRLQPDKGTTYELTIAIENEAPTTLPLTQPNRRHANINALQQAIERVNTMLTASAYNRHSAPQQTPEDAPEAPYSRVAPFQAEALGKTVGAEATEAAFVNSELQTGKDSSSSRKDTPTPAPLPRGDYELPVTRPQSPDSRHLLSYIGSELSEIRDVLHILLSNARATQAADLPDEILGIHRKFLKNDMEAGLAHDLAAAMQPCFQDERGRSIHEQLTMLLTKIVRTSGGVQFSDGPAVVALVGPTGVGKTTTLAKLAAQYQLRKKKTVLITIDDYRIGAIEQLQTYASILNVSMEAAHEPEELEEQIARHASADLILIDTPGRSQLDAPRIRSIEAFLNAARPTETHLLINMTTRNQDINSVIDRFGTLGVDRLIFTKLDESTGYGPILNVSVRTKKPISYLTTGQDVAKDIEVATHSRIATFLLRGFQKQGVEGIGSRE